MDVGPHQELKNPGTPLRECAGLGMMIQVFVFSGRPVTTVPGNRCRVHRTRTMTFDKIGRVAIVIATRPKMAEGS